MDKYYKKSILIGLGVSISVLSIELVADFIIDYDKNAAESEKFDLESLLNWIIIGIILSPTVETIIFWVIGFMLISKQTILSILYLIVMTSIGWAIHGGGLDGVSKAIGYMILAICFIKFRELYGFLAAFVGTLVAHSTWNFIIVLLWSILNIFKILI